MTWYNHSLLSMIKLPHFSLVCLRLMIWFEFSEVNVKCCRHTSCVQRSVFTHPSLVSVSRWPQRDQSLLPLAVSCVQTCCITQPSGLYLGQTTAIGCQIWKSGKSGIAGIKIASCIPLLLLSVLHHAAASCSLARMFATDTLNSHRIRVALSAASQFRPNLTNVVIELGHG